MFVGAKKDTRDVGGEGAVFAGSKKCTRDGFACCHAEQREASPRWSASRGFFVTLRMTAQGAIANYSLLIILDSHIAPRQDSP